MKIKLEFEKGDPVTCEILGSLKNNGNTYAVMKNIKNKDIYIYRYARSAKGYKFKEIRDNEEFREVYKLLISKTRFEGGPEK